MMSIQQTNTDNYEASSNYVFEPGYPDIFFKFIVLAMKLKTK